MMKKILLLIFILGYCIPAFSYDNKLLAEECDKQLLINNIGVEILNKNRINKRIIFTYNKKNYSKTIKDQTLSKRQIIFYEDYFKYTENDDEIAGFLAHEISRAVKSYSGEWGGIVGATQIKAAPKKYEIFADKRAVDYMVRAGYNPLGLITFINKSHPQGLFDKLLFHNTSSKRLAIIYEYIYFNYPNFLNSESYRNNINYQNFLLNSTYNRNLLKEKVQSGSKKELKYK